MRTSFYCTLAPPSHVTSAAILLFSNWTLEGFWKGECQNCIEPFVGDHDGLVFRIDGEIPYLRQDIVRDRPSRCGVPVVINTPDAEKTLCLFRRLKVIRVFYSLPRSTEFASAGNEHTCATDHHRSVGSGGAALGSAGNDPDRLHIAAGSAVENPKAAPPACEQKIVIRIDGDAIPTDADVRSFQGPDGRGVSLRCAVEDVNHTAVRSSHRNENLVVNGIGV